MDQGRSHLAVIGSAGRLDDAARLDRAAYDAMYEELLEAMDQWSVRSLVSGGAAFADHLAVRAYLEGSAAALDLFLPARFDGVRYAARHNDPRDAGATANRLHERARPSLGVDGLAEIAQAIAKGAKVVVRPGFKTRNLDVAAKATHMLAFTYGADRSPVDLRPGDPGFTDAMAAGLKEGGTAHTWGEAYRCAVKRHVSIGWLVRQRGPSGRP
jgi:hypothetical protein